MNDDFDDEEEEMVTAVEEMVLHLDLGPIEFARRIGVSNQCLYQLRKGRSCASWETFVSIRREFPEAMRELGFVAADFCDRAE